MRPDKREGLPLTPRSCRQSLSKCARENALVKPIHRAGIRRCRQGSLKLASGGGVTARSLGRSICGIQSYGSR